MRLDLNNTGAVTYGSHMAVSMAIGFLFLGGGSQSFGTDDAAIASLLIALFPRFPDFTSDQRSHLQAFRHLYALAARKRLLKAVNPETGEMVSAPLEVGVAAPGPAGGGTVSVSLVTPCLLPVRASVCVRAPQRTNDKRVSPQQ